MTNNPIQRINQAISNQEAQAERLANSGRIIFLSVITLLAIINIKSVSFEANIMNFSVLLFGYTYGLIVFFRMRRSGYHTSMKYITSCLDILMVFLLLVLYTRIEIPSVALKNYVYIIVYLLIGLTAFRYDWKLTWAAGALTVGLYLVLIIYLYLTGSIELTWGGYDKELFSREVTYIGQATKLILLIGFIALIGYLAQYSRRLIIKLVSDESIIRQEHEQIKYEIELASNVQKQFVPHSFPEIPGLSINGIVEQGKSVGGDYCDFIHIAKDRLLVVVADVSGNGIQAALIMAEVRASIHLLTEMKIGLEQVVKSINTLLIESTNKKAFVTFFAADINITDHIISYVNAGHPQPIIFYSNKISLLKKGTIPLGIREQLPHFSLLTEDFRAGSCLIAYTDGLLEQFDTQMEQYGENRLYQFVQSNAHLDVHTFSQRLLEDVKNFSKAVAFDDDVSLGIVKYS